MMRLHWRTIVEADKMEIELISIRDKQGRVINDCQLAPSSCQNCGGKTLDLKLSPQKLKHGHNA